MPSASEQLFAEAGLDAFGHPPGYGAPKPPSPRKIALLAARCDRLEREAHDETYFLRWGVSSAAEWEAIMHRWHQAKLAYGDAIKARNQYKRRKAQLSKQRVKSQEKLPLEDAMFAAERHLDLIVAAGPDFCTQREFTDANAAFTLASDLYAIAEKKFDIQEREVRADKRAGIRRFPASRVHRH